MSFSERIDAFQRKHPATGYPLGVVYKFFDDFGGYLAALITYYGFLSLFPLLLLFSTILGLVLEGYPQWQQRILDSAISEFPIVGEELRKTGTLSGSPIGLVVGSLAAIYGGLGVGQALQQAVDQVAAPEPAEAGPGAFAPRQRRRRRDAFLLLHLRGRGEAGGGVGREEGCVTKILYLSRRAASVAKYVRI